jgi:hypothetical protein
MHGMSNIKFANAKQAKEVYLYKNSSAKLHKTKSRTPYGITVCSLTSKQIPTTISTATRMALTWPQAGVAYEYRQWQVMFFCQKFQKWSETNTACRLMTTEVAFPRGKASIHEVDHSPSSSAYVKNEWKHTSTSRIRFHVPYRDKFDLPLPFISVYRTTNSCRVSTSMVLVLRRQKRKVLGCSRDNEVTY